MYFLDFLFFLVTIVNTTPLSPNPDDSAVNLNSGISPNPGESFVLDNDFTVASDSSAVGTPQQSNIDDVALAINSDTAGSSENMCQSENIQDDDGLNARDVPGAMCRPRSDIDEPDGSENQQNNNE